MRQPEADHVRQAGERLTRRVLEEAFPELARGFVDAVRSRDGATAELTQEQLDEAFRAAVGLLYRLLFLLYAEALELVPGEGEGQSLRQLTREVAAAAGTVRDEVGPRLSAAYSAERSATRLNERLLGLLGRANRGVALPAWVLAASGRGTSPRATDDPGPQVHPGQEGLWGQQVCPGQGVPGMRYVRPEVATAGFLARYSVADRFLARALDGIAREADETSGEMVAINYATLGVRPLGSIYERLLEHRLRVAPEKMAVVRGKKTRRVVPYRDAVAKRSILVEGRGRAARERTLPKGAVYLEKDDRERKASGTYYTPDHMVKYLVEAAVGPALQEHLERLRPKLRQAQQASQEAQRRQRVCQPLEGRGRDAEHVAEESRWHALAEEMFAFRVVDPAMGSGHFLAEAVDFITERMAEFLGSFQGNPVRPMLRQAREAIQAELDRQGTTIDAGKLGEIDLLRRQVLQRCIYGVDVDPTAVELARMSLWLHCRVVGAPLSFLDDHLKCGNSLVGVSVEEVREALGAEQPSVQDGEQAGSAQGEERARYSWLQRWEGSLRQGWRGEPGRLSGSLLPDGREPERSAGSPPREGMDGRAACPRGADVPGTARAPMKAVMDLYTSRWFEGEPRRVGRGSERGLDPMLAFLRSGAAERWLDGGCTAGLLAEPARALIERGLLSAAEQRFFHWEVEFPEVFCRFPRSLSETPGAASDGAVRAGETPAPPRACAGVKVSSMAVSGAIEPGPAGGFDAVIGNPPWGATMSPRLKAWSRQRFAAMSHGETDYCVAFLELALRLTRRGGGLGLLLPDIVLLKQYPQARHRLLTQLQLSEVVHWGRPFQRVNLDVCSVVGRRVATVDPESTVRCVVDIADWSRGEYTINRIPQGRFLAGKDYRFNLYLSDELHACLERIRARSRPMREYLELHEGIHSGNARARLFVDACQQPDCRRLILRGDEVSAFMIAWAGKWVRWNPAIIDRAAGEYANLAHLHYFLSPKLLVRRTGDRIIAARDDDQLFASNNFFVGLARDGHRLPLGGLEALLNARLSTWFFRAIQPRTGRLFAEVKITHLEDLPVPSSLTESDWAWLDGRARSVQGLLATGERDSAQVAEHVRGEVEACLLEALGVSQRELELAASFRRG